MGKIKIGVQLYSLRNYIVDTKSMADVFKRVKSFGAEAVQVSGGKKIDSKDLKKISEDNNLPICITHSPYDRIINDIDRLAEEHLIFKCKNIGIGMMPKKFRTGKLSDIQYFAESLNNTAEKLASYGMNIAYHNHHFEFKTIDNKVIYNYLIENTRKEVQFIPDTFWIKVGGYEPIEYINRLSGRINTLHLKDYKKTLGIPIFRAIGKGIFDFKKILFEAENSGVLNAVVELDLAPNPYKSIEQSINYLKSIY